MRIVLALLLLLAALPLLAIELDVFDVFPTQGSVAGGDVVLIDVRIRNAPFCDPVACENLLNVTFGGVRARSVVYRGHGLFEAITPPHARGNVAVGVELLGVNKSNFVYTYADRETFPMPQNYDTVLVPVAITAPDGAAGGFGSLWKTELWVTNRGANRVELFFENPRCAPDTGCGGSGYPALAPGEVRQLVLPAGSRGDGLLIWVQKGGAADVAFSLRVRDVSRSEDNHGTELPLPRQADRREQVTLLNVPIDNRSRAALRIYSDYFGQFAAQVTFTPMNGGAAVTKIVPVNAPAEGFRAAMTFVDVGAVFPELAEGAYRVDINGPRVPLWALASVTNNRTQLVTAIEPQ